MIPLIFSFNAISSLVPIILILLLIAAAGGLMRGSSFFDLLGFGTLMGFTQGATKSNIKGLKRGYGSGIYNIRYGSHKPTTVNLFKKKEAKDIKTGRVQRDIATAAILQKRSGGVLPPPGSSATMQDKKRYMRYATRLEDVRAKKSVINAKIEKRKDNMGKLEKDLAAAALIGGATGSFKRAQIRSQIASQKNAIDKITDKYAVANAKLDANEASYYLKQYKARYGRAALGDIRNARSEYYSTKFGRFGRARAIQDTLGKRFGQSAAAPFAFAALGATAVVGTRERIKTVSKSGLSGYFKDQNSTLRSSFNTAFDKHLEIDRVNAPPPPVPPSEQAAFNQAEFEALAVKTEKSYMFGAVNVKIKHPYMSRGLYDWTRGATNVSNKNIAKSIFLTHYKGVHLLRKKVVDKK